MSSTIQADIEQQLARVEPEVEVLLAEVAGGAGVAVAIEGREPVAKKSLRLSPLTELVHLTAQPPFPENRR